MEILAGTSGYAYKEWKGTFYPEDLSSDDMLSYYAGHFGTVEINHTFYRMPRESVLEAWAAQVPEGFQFVLKASRRITHVQRLKDVDEPLSYLLNTAAVLGQRLGPFLFQFPPNMKKDLDRLRGFLTSFPAKRRAAFEFRHDSWHDDEVHELLREHKQALCIADTDDQAGTIVRTADWGYLRLRRTAYEPGDLRRWATTIQNQDWERVYVFFKHEDEGAGPRLAKAFLAEAEPE